MPAHKNDGNLKNFNKFKNYYRFRNFFANFFCFIKKFLIKKYYRKLVSKILFTKTIKIEHNPYKIAEIAFLKLED